jgi:sugar phosphate isomerase/epimerase
MDGQEPGMGDYDFGALMKCLSELDYQGWVSLEAFDFIRDPREVVTRSINHLKAVS